MGFGGVGVEGWDCTPRAKSDIYDCLLIINIITTTMLRPSLKATQYSAHAPSHVICE